MLKLAFMGTPEFAVASLERLIDSPHEVVLAVTQPSKPKGRGKKIVDPPVKESADDRGLEVIQPRSLIKEPIDERVRELGVDVLIVVAYGKILPDSLLAAPRIGCLNVHASLLPEFRGAAPIQRAIMDGRTETGVTIMKMVSELDAGAIVAQQRIEISVDDDALSTANWMSVLGADLLLRVLDDVEKDQAIEGEEQDHERATYAEKITKDEGVVDWTLPSEQIMYHLRALTPWPGLFTTRKKKTLRLVQAEPLDSAQAAHDKLLEKTPPGTITGIVAGFGFTVSTGDGHLLVTRVQPQSKQARDTVDYLNGNPVTPGEKLGD